MFDVKVFYFLIALLIGGYSVLVVLNQIEGIREKLRGHLGFENLLIFCAFFVLFAGIWFKGYKEGKKEWVKQE